MHPFPLILRDPDSIVQQIHSWRCDGMRIGFVPTMGALHDGHMALVDTAKEWCDRVAVSIFVNPTQFGPNEDYSRYPRSIDRDVDLLSQHGCDLVYLPDVHTIYPKGFASTVHVQAEMADVLCGAHRPGHFGGVATVVTILLNTLHPDASFFGEKDYQQLQIIRRVKADLRLPGSIHAVPTLREADGLAYSSRNQYLSADERKRAPVLYATLTWMRRELEGRPASGVIEEARERLNAAGFEQIDYLELRHGETLAPLEENLSGGRIFAAAWLGRTRLIDNIEL